MVFKSKTALYPKIENPSRQIHFRVKIESLSRKNLFRVKIVQRIKISLDQNRKKSTISFFDYFDPNSAIFPQNFNLKSYF